jgi:hypothetical protein
MQHSKLVVAQAFGSQVEADLAKSALESAGIDAMIQADTAGGMRPHIAWSGFGFRVLVREEDAATARDVLKPPEEPPASNLVAIQSFGTQDEAEIARDALESAGIAAMIQTDLAGSVLGLEGFRIVVQEENVVKAREILKPPHKTHA